jgi:hypothetical protein
VLSAHTPRPRCTHREDDSDEPVPTPPSPDICTGTVVQALPVSLEALVVVPRHEVEEGRQPLLTAMVAPGRMDGVAGPGTARSRDVAGLGREPIEGAARCLLQAETD